MKIIFAGTPAVAVTPLLALLRSDHDLVAVYTQPDRPAGRGKKLMPSPVKQCALENHLPIEQPEHFKSDAVCEKLNAYQADIMVVMAYGLLLPSRVLSTPKYGCINIHVSLLPRWRGAAPVQHAILEGDRETGLTIMQMDKGLDTGDILNQSSCLIETHDTSEDVYEKLLTITPSLLLKTITDIGQGKTHPLSQNHHDATYAHKIEKHHAKIEWHDMTETIDRKVRAYYPEPIAFFEWRGERIRIWKGIIMTGMFPGLPGDIIAMDKQGITIKTHDAAYCITCLQFSGKNPLLGHDIVNAWKQRFR